jgi:hypothetical protein
MGRRSSSRNISARSTRPFSARSTPARCWQVRSEGRIREFEPIAGTSRFTRHGTSASGTTRHLVVSGHRGRPFIIDCYTASGVGVDHYAEICHAKPWTRGNDFVPHDAKVKEWGTGRTRVETMRGLGLNPVLVPMATKLDGMQAARSTLPKCCFPHALTRRSACPRWSSTGANGTTRRRHSRRLRSTTGRAIWLMRLPLSRSRKGQQNDHGAT